MRAPLNSCSWRSAVAVLASGAVISLSALSGGVAPAYAKPDKNDPGIPIVPTPEVVVPEAPQVVPQERAPAESPRAPKEPPAPVPQVESPPQQAPVPVVQPPAPPPEPVPQPQAPAPRKESPRVVEAPKVDAPKVDSPKVASPAVDPPKSDAPKVDVPQGDAPKANAPKADAPKVDAPKSDVPQVGPLKVDPPKADPPKVDEPAPLPAPDQPAKAGDPKQDAQLPRNPAPGQTPEVSTGADEKQPAAADEAKPAPVGSPDAAKRNDPATAPKVAQRATMAAPDTLQAPEQDIQLARQSKPTEVKPEPAKKDDVDFLSSALNIDSKTKLGPFESEIKAGSEFSIGDRDRDWERDRDWDRDRDRDRNHDHDWDWDKKRWDHRVRQWDRRWIEYDDFYRPVFFNPFRAPVRIVYLYERAPRIVYLPPLARVVVDAAALAAYSFTAVVLNTANLAADVAVGSFFGGGYLPPIGAPFVPPPPLLRYDNVPVQVRYSNATYQPFRVNQIVDVGDDVQYGGRKVLLDGATPAWGQWTTSPTGERQFEVHRTQQYPGLGEPQEAPLPGDYRMQLASDESAKFDRTQVYLMAAAGVIAGLGFGALGLALFLGRRRPQL
jgi:hypothetical protein